MCGVVDGVDLQVAAGARAAGVEVMIYGPAAEIGDGPDVVDAPDWITNEEEPVRAVRSRPQASVVQAARAVAEGRAQAVVSPGSTGALLAASAHNMPVDSWPWRFASVLSVGSHAEPDPEIFFSNPSPPVEFFARGLDVEVAWAGGTTIRASGNSFATPHMAAMAARVLGAHPGLRPFQVKTVLHLSATNVGSDA